jgi:hypothetical protein
MMNIIMMNIILAMTATTFATNGSVNTAANCAAITAVGTKTIAPSATLRIFKEENND